MSVPPDSIAAGTLSVILPTASITLDATAGSARGHACAVCGNPNQDALIEVRVERPADSPGVVAVCGGCLVAGLSVRLGAAASATRLPDGRRVVDVRWVTGDEQCSADSVRGGDTVPDGRQAPDEEGPTDAH